MRNHTKPNRTERHNLNLIRQKISHSCHTKYDLQQRRWQQRSKWNISFGDEMKQEQSEHCQRECITKEYIRTYRIPVMVSCDATTSITESSNYRFVYATGFQLSLLLSQTLSLSFSLSLFLCFTRRIVIELLQKRQTWKMKCNREKNSHNFFTVLSIFCSWFRLDCVHKFLMLTAPLALFEFLLRPVAISSSYAILLSGRQL